MLVFVAVFVWLGGAAEAEAVRLDAALHETRVGDAMVSHFDSLSAHAPVALGVEKVIHSPQDVFPVLDEGHLVGFVDGRFLLEHAALGGTDDPVEALCRPSEGALGPDDLLQTCLGRLEESDNGVLPVLADGRLIGMLARDNVLRLAQLRDRVATWYPPAFQGNA